MKFLLLLSALLLSSCDDADVRNPEPEIPTYIKHKL